MESMLTLHSTPGNRSLQGQLLCCCMDLVQAMLFGRPDPDPKVGESRVPSSGSSLSGNDNVKHGPYLCKLHPVDLTYWVSARFNIT